MLCFYLDDIGKEEVYLSSLPLEWRSVEREKGNPLEINWRRERLVFFANLQFLEQVPVL